MSRGEMIAGNFSNLDAAGEASPYVAYLDRARLALVELRQFGNQLLELKPGGSILDVGCGAGDALHDLAQSVGPGGRAVGLDASDTMVGEARKRAESAGLPISFHHGDARRLPFTDAEFDACTAERVFVHLDNPAAALGEMIRVARPGGRIVVREPDLEMVMLDSSDHKTARAVWNFFAGGVRNGYIGRELFNLFRQAGLTEVAVYPRPLSINSFDLFNTVLPFEASAQAAAERAVIDRTACDSMLADLRRRDAAGRFFGCILGFIAAGRKA